MRMIGDPERRSTIMTIRTSRRRPAPPAAHPKEAPIETRLQTQYKLEFQGRYSKTWPAIVSQARGFPFCIRDLWMIDAFAGRGLHPSTGHPDGMRRGTTLQAIVGARLAQIEHPPSIVHVRAIENDPRQAAALESVIAPYRG